MQMSYSVYFNGKTTLLQLMDEVKALPGNEYTVVYIIDVHLVLRRGFTNN